MIGNRINIFGKPGSGKTELADKLGALLGFNNVYHLDYYFWKPGWVKTQLKERLEILDRLQASDQWIFEGNFSNVVEHRLMNSDTVILLDTPRLVCLWRVLRRRLKYFGGEPSEIAKGCPDKISFEFLKSIWDFPIKDGVELNNKIKLNNSRYELFVLRNQNDITEFFSKLQR